MHTIYASRFCVCRYACTYAYVLRPTSHTRLSHIRTHTSPSFLLIYPNIQDTNALRLICVCFTHTRTTPLLYITHAYAVHAPRRPQHTRMYAHFCIRLLFVWVGFYMFVYMHACLHVYTNVSIVRCPAVSVAHTHMNVQTQTHYILSLVGLIGSQHRNLT